MLIDRFKKQTDVELLIVCLCIAFICYGGYVYPHYATDTYRVVANLEFTLRDIWEEYTFPYLKAGRYGLGILMYIVAMFRIHPLLNNVVSNVLSICFIGLSLYHLVYRLSSYLEFRSTRKFKLLLVATPIFINPLYADWFQFPECVVYYSLGLYLVTILAFKVFFQESYTSIKRKVFYIGSLIFVIGIYQILLNVFFILSLFIIYMIYLKKNTATKVLIKEFLFLLFLYTGISLIQLTIIKVFGNGIRTNTDIINNTIYVIKMQPVLWAMKTTGNGNVWLVITTLVVLAFNIVSIFTIQGIPKSKEFLLFILFFVVISGILYSTHILAEPWLSQRTVVLLYGFPGILGLLFLCRKQTDSSLQAYFNLALVFFLVLNTVYIYRTNNISIGMQKTNSLDKQIVLQIRAEIEDYEKVSGIQVSKIAFKNDAQLNWSYPDVFCMFDLNVRAWAVDWARKNMVEFYMQRKFDEIEMDDVIYQRYFFEKNWNTYEESQTEIVGDTIYIMVY